jgi:very-short-patch-repair endonuclease
VFGHHAPVSDFDDDAFFEHVLAYDEPGLAGATSTTPAAQWREWWRRRWLDCGQSAITRRAREQGFVLTTAQVYDCGWDRHDLRREARWRRWWSPLRGVWSPITPSSADPFEASRRRHALVGAAAALLRPDHVVAAATATIMHGLPTLVVPELPELLTRAAHTSGRHTRGLVRTTTLPDLDVTDWFGVPVTTVARTVVDQARHGRRDGLVAADAALCERLVARDDLDQALATLAGRRGIRRAREVLALATPLAESTLESLVRLALHDDAFPTPRLQVVIRTYAGAYRVDMLFEEQRLIVEADGLRKYTGGERQREKVRESRLRAMNYRVERVLWEDVMTYWPQTRARLLAALADTPRQGSFRGWETGPAGGYRG